MDISLAKAVRNLAPNSEFTIKENDYSTIVWHILEGNAPTQTEIDAEVEKIKANEISETITKAAARKAVLDRLGLTEEEAQLILGGSN